ncbi:MAG: cupin-like domain-containing protein [Polyangiales bacterium]
MLSPRLSRDDPSATSPRAWPVPYADAPRDLDAALSLTRRGPWVLRGVFDDATLARLRASALLDAHPDAVPVAPVCEGRVVIDPRRGLGTAPRRLDDLIHSLATGTNDGYVAATRDELPAALAAAVASPAFTLGAPWRVGRLWVGGAGTVSALHRDLSHNAHTVIEGRKRFWIASTAHDRDLYPARPWSSVPNGSRVDPERVDLARFPHAARVRPWVAELGPGETLLLPSRWWHHVRTLDLSVSVNTFFATGSLARVVAAANAAKSLRGLNR